MSHDPEPISDAQVDAALRELAGDDLHEARDRFGTVPPGIAAQHVRMAARAAATIDGDRVPVADLEAIRARRAGELTRRRRRIAAVAGWAAAGFVGIGGASAGLAAAEALPRPAARVIAAAVDAVGLPVPQTVERAAAGPVETVSVPAPDPDQALAAAQVGEGDPIPPSTAAPTTAAAPTQPTMGANAAVQAPPTTSAPRATAPATPTTAVSALGCASSTSVVPSTSSTSTTATTAPSSTTTSTTVASTTTTDGCDAQGQGVDRPASTTTSTTPTTVEARSDDASADD